MGDDAGHLTRGYTSGAVDYLMKPIDPDVLRAKVSVFAELHRKTVELERKTAELQRSNAELELFSLAASHDLQEPLRVVAGYLELLRDSAAGALDEEARSWIDRASAATGRMSTLIRDLLAYARSVEGSRERLVPVALDQVLDTVRQNLAVAIAESHADIRAARLPIVVGTAGELTQVMQNLVGNAIKFRAEERPIISIDAVRQDTTCLITVRDNGIGIPADKTQKVFGAFERIDRARYPGTGLGLSMCKRIVERLGGTIWIEPAEARGTVVRLTLSAAT
jgi:light-regulated signal transduction histidine kinase (bacteriophytochrome)